VTSRDELAGRKLGDFVVRERLGEGGFGVVYRAMQPLLGRDVVLKVLHRRYEGDARILHRFLQEARLASRLDHPFAAHVYAMGVERDGLLWIAMELVDGLSLDRWLAERGPIAPGALVPFIEQLAEVVHTAHERGIVHRDLKPANVMVIERAGRLLPKLLDLGVAKLLESTEPPLDADEPDELRARRTITQGVAIGSPPYMAPEQWNGGDVGPRSDVYALGVLVYEAVTGRRPFIARAREEFAALHACGTVPSLGGEHPAALEAFLQRALAKHPDQRPQTALAFAAELRQACASLRAEDDERPPYRGLAPFELSDREWFVGRETEIGALLARWHDHRLQIVVGPAGAGKSSFVRAGVVARLADWCVIVFRPGEDPLAALAAAAGCEEVGQADRLRDPEHRRASLSRLADRAGMGVVLVVDQLEEIFSRTREGEQRAALAALLGDIARGADPRVRAICTLRDDFLMRAAALEPLRHELSRALFLLSNPSRTDMIRAIVDPAARLGYALEDDGLAEEMVEEVIERPGALALLSFGASRLWEMRDRATRRLTRRAYQEMGGLAGALGQHAEAAYAAFEVADQRLIGRIFRLLVTAERVRATIALEELEPRLGPRAAVLIERLVADRLVVLEQRDGDPVGHQVELAHEALIEAWPRLQRWASADLAARKLGEQVRASARQWDARGRPRGLLWRGEALRELEVSGVATTGIEAEFARTSSAEARRVRRAKAAAVAAMVCVIVVAGTLLVAANREAERRAAQAAASDAQTRTLLAAQYKEQARLELLAGRHGPAMVLLLAALDAGAPHDPALEIMLGEASRSLDAQRVVGGTGERALEWLRANRDGSLAITLDADHRAQLWDLLRRVQIGDLRPSFGIVLGIGMDDAGRRIWTSATDGVVRIYGADGRLVRELCPVPRGTAPGAMMSPDGGWIACIDGTTLARWQVDRESVVWRSELPDRDVTAMAAGPDGRQLHVAGRSWLVTIDADTGKQVIARHGHEGPIAHIAISVDGSILTTAGSDGTVRVWDPSGARPRLTFGPFTDRVVAVDATTELVAATTQDGTLRLWDARSGEPRRVAGSHAGSASALHFVRGGLGLVSAGADGLVRQWDPRTGLLVASLAGHAGRVHRASVTRDGRVITAGHDGTLRLWTPSWETRGTVAVPRRRDQSPVMSWTGDRVALASTRGGMVWSPVSATLRELVHDAATVVAVGGDRGLAMTGARDGSIRIWQAGEAVVELGGHTVAIRGARFDSTARQLITVDDSGTLYRWDLTQQPPTGLLIASSPGTTGAVFRGDGSWIAAVGHEGIRIWDSARGAVLATFGDHRAGVLEFSPSGDLLAAGGDDGVLRLWRDDGRPLHAITAHRGDIITVQFAPAGDRLVTVGGDRVARIWQVATGALLGEIDAASQTVLDATFVRGGAIVATIGSDRLVQLWDVASGKPLARIFQHHAERGSHDIANVGEVLVSRSNDTLAATVLVPAPQDLTHLRTLTRCLIPLVIEHGTLIRRSLPADSADRQILPKAKCP
jgi:WD40 repeat protein